MAVFVSTRYEDDDGLIHPVRLSAAVAAVANNPPPTGAVSDKVSAATSKSRRGYGLHARRVNLKRTVNSSEGTVSVFAQIPLLTPATAAGAQWSNGSTITYASKTWSVTTPLEELKK